VRGERCAGLRVAAAQLDAARLGWVGWSGKLLPAATQARTVLRSIALV